MSKESQYRQFVTTLVDSDNKLIQITSQPPPDYIAVKRKRNRTSISCLTCKRRKVKCDRQRPICGSCVKYGYNSCIYDSDNVFEGESDGNISSVGMNNNGSTSSVNDNNNNNNNSTISKNNIKFINNKENQRIHKTLINDNETDNDQSNKIYNSRKCTEEFKNLLKTLDTLKETHVQNDEIDNLRRKIENLRFYLDDNSIANSIILKNLPLIGNLTLVPILKTNSTISMNSFNLQFGASSLTSYVDIDHYMGYIFQKSLPKIENDIEIWKSKFSVDIYTEALEMIIINGNYNTNHNSTLNDVKRSKFRFICSLLEKYFINYNTFINLLNRSTSIMLIAVPVVPLTLINELVNKHFLSANNGQLIITNINDSDDFSEILLILAVLRFGLPKSENVLITPNELDYTNLLNTESILTDYKTDLLNSFLKIILNETDLSQKYNIPMLGTLIILFMISYTHRFNFKSGNTGISLNYGIIAIYMAVNLGIYSKSGISENLLQENSNNNYHKFLKNDDYHNIWNLVMFIDTFTSFNSGIPQLISSNMENIYLTKFLDSNCADICRYYRKAFKLANNGNFSNNEKVSIIKYERFVIEFESFIVNKIIPTSICLTNNDLVGVATSIRSLNLLLFLYYNSYFSIVKTIENFKSTNNPQNNIKYSLYMKQFNELEKRLFNRCIRLSIISLINLNNMLVSTFSEKDGSFYEKYSFDLIQIFTRIVYTLTSCVCKMISVNKSKLAGNLDSENNVENIENFNYLFDISRKQSEDLSRYFIILQSQNLHLNENFSPDIIQIFNKVNKLSNYPSAIIKLLIGFFFNTSQSLISQNFIYYALYKYFVMAVNEFQDMNVNLEDFDIDTFMKHYSHVDCTWFINK